MGGGGGVQPASQGEITNANIAQEQWDYYKNKLAPLDDQRIARAKNKDRGRALGINMSAAGAGQAFSRNEVGITNSLATHGIDPNSGKFSTALTGTITDRSRGVGMAAVGANTAADQRYAGGMFNVIAHGRGKQGIALQGIRQSAQRQTSDALFAARMKAQSEAAMYQGIGTAVGFAGGAAYSSGMFDKAKP